MEKKSAVLGAAGMLLVGGLAFGLVGIANAENQPAPTVATVAPSATPTATQEPVVTEPVVSPAPVEPAAPVVAEPAPAVEAPAPVVVEPVAPAYVAPVAPAAPPAVYVPPVTNGTVNAPAATDDIKNTGRNAQPTDGSVAIVPGR